MLTDNRVFLKLELSYFFVQALAFTKSLLLVYQQISLTWYVLIVGTSSTHQLVRVIPGQLIMVKQLKIYVYSIKVRYL